MRSIKGVSAVAILAECSKRYRAETGEKLFVGFGGHVGAAGFKIKKEKIPELERIYREVAKVIVKGRRSKVVVAGKLTALQGTSKEEIKLFQRFLAPFGSGFEQPKFEIKTKVVSWQAMGRDHQHIKGMLEGGIPFVYYFGNQAWVKLALLRKEVRLVVKVGIESYHGKENVQLTVEDIKHAG
jgi:single-stranded DNA-specific DHH superfamily exonuclease